ncbi:MAG: PEGA domain-containing protein [Candidatus Acidiferrales bacterium]
MRTTALIFVLFCVSASVASANNRQWKDAKVVDITSDNNGSVDASSGTLSVTVPITRTFYWIQTEDMTYVLGPAVTPCDRLLRRCPYILDVTLYGKTKIAIDGRYAHILDDDGKDEKIPIAQKIAGTGAPSDQSKPETGFSSGAYQVDAGAHSFSPYGVVFVSSNPSGADIYVDDSFIAKSPVTLNLKPGQHYIRAFMNDYKNWSQQITVAADSEGHLTIALEKSN